MALSGEPVNVPDAYSLPPGSPFKISRSFDERAGYRTRSMLAVPMRDHDGAVIGVVMLVNKKRSRSVVLQPATVVETEVIPFTTVDEEIARSLASQAAVAFERAALIEERQVRSGGKNQFDALVRGALEINEVFSPFEANHARRVAVLTVRIAEKVNAASAGPLRDLHFSGDQLQAIRYAGLLHDIGKIGMPLHPRKEKKLYTGQMLVIESRFKCAKRTLETEHLRAQLAQVRSGAATEELLAEMDFAHQAAQEELDGLLQAVRHANEPSAAQVDTSALTDLSKRSYADIDGSRQPLLSADEVAALSIRRGYLSESEEAGVYIVLSADRRHVFVTGRSEYDPLTLQSEYVRDVGKGLEIAVPRSYYPEDDPRREPVVRWRGHASLLYANWLNYYVYQQTPYDVDAIPEGSAGR